MMTSTVLVTAGRPGEFLLARGGGSGAMSSRGLAAATLISWLIAELLGAAMLRSWIASGGARDRQGRPHGLSPALIFGHAGLALAGLVSWIAFLVTGSAAIAWLAIGFLAVAIGLGVSTVTVWTPYPARRPPAVGSPRPPGEYGPALVITDEMLDRALASETLTSRLVDDLVERMLAEPGPAPPGHRRWQLAPVLPILHGVLAIATFLLAMLAAIAAGGS